VKKGGKGKDGKTGNKQQQQQQQRNSRPPPGKLFLTDLISETPATTAANTGLS